jgi:FemAB-related protein (PEP-CTERM system-associated)
LIVSAHWSLPPPSGDPPARVTVELATDPEAWNGFVARVPGASISHRWEWGAVIAEAYGHRTHRFVARGPAGIAGVLALVEVRSRLFGSRLTSMPYLDDGGVLATTESAWTGLLSAALALAARLRIRSIELRQRNRPRADLPTHDDRATLVLTLPAGNGAHGAEARVAALWKAIGQKPRNQVRKAEKAGLVAERRGPEAIADFYRVWQVNMRDLGSPAHSARFFARVGAHFAPETAVYLVRHEAQVIGGLVALEHAGSVVVPWASSDRRFFALCPNNLLYWTALRDAAERGLTSFDFGRSAPGSGTFLFKQQWGAVPLPLYWQDLDPIAGEIPLLAPGAEPRRAPPPLSDKQRRIGEAVWKRLPVPVATFLGARIRGGITL